MQQAANDPAHWRGGSPDLGDTALDPPTKEKGAVPDSEEESDEEEEEMPTPRVFNEHETTALMGGAEEKRELEQRGVTATRKRQRRVRQQQHRSSVLGVCHSESPTKQHCSTPRYCQNTDLSRTPSRGSLFPFETPMVPFFLKRRAFPCQCPGRSPA